MRATVSVLWSAMSMPRSVMRLDVPLSAGRELGLVAFPEAGLPERPCVCSLEKETTERARLPLMADAVEKRHGVAVFAIEGRFRPFLAGRWSQIGKHHAQPGKLLRQSPHRLLLLAGRVDAAPMSGGSAQWRRDEIRRGRR